MTSSLVIYAKLINFFSTLFLIIFVFEAVNTSSTNFKKSFCIFAENKIFEKSKMADML